MSSIPVANDGAHAAIRLIGCEQDANSESKSNLRSDQPQTPADQDRVLTESRRNFDSPAGDPKPTSKSISRPRQTYSLKGVVRAGLVNAALATGQKIPERVIRVQQIEELPAAAEAHRSSATGAKQEASCGPFHRVQEVRAQQGISIRSMSRRLGIDAKTYRALEDPSNDLRLSDLSKIQQAMDVPMSDLLVDRDSLSRPVEERAKMVKAMKTAVALRDVKSSPRIERMARMLCEQLIELMPELKEVSGWPKFGARRGESALGKALCQPIDMSHLRAPEE